MPPGKGPSGRTIGRYVLYDEIASGGMASVHLGRLIGSVGFSRTVAIKRLHPHFAKDRQFVDMFLDEAHLASRIRHPNVIATLDVVSTDSELFLVMDYVEGESLARLAGAARERAERVDPAIAVSVVVDVLYGLEAAHEATNERGEPLDIVHRDVSPQNILVGADGIARVVDFGVAKAASRIQTTRDGAIKGKLAYMSPEQMRRQPVDRRTDVFAASIILWETLAGARLFSADDPGGMVAQVLEAAVEPPSRRAGDLPHGLDAIVLRGLAHEPSARFQTAREMATALEAALAPASRTKVADWVARNAGEALGARAERIAAIESGAERPHPVPLERSEAETAVLTGDGAGVSPPHGSAPPALRSPVAGTSIVTTAPAPRSATRSAVVVVALAAAVAGGAWWLAGRRALGDAPTSTASATAPASAPAHPTPLLSSPPAVEPAPEQASPAPTADPATSARAVLQPRSAASARPGCIPPYAWDPVRKIKVYKEHCFK